MLNVSTMVTFHILIVNIRTASSEWAFRKRKKEKKQLKIGVSKIEVENILLIGTFNI